MSRYHLAAEAIRRAAQSPGSRVRDRAPTLISRCQSLVGQATAYSREHLQDMPEIRDWTWTGE
jgi:xylulose-5-phosphate/fructose-6-phosphate phosphoketolase